MSRHPLSPFAAFVVHLFLVLTVSAPAGADSLPLMVTRIDADYVLDTVYGFEAGDAGFLPSSIRFGIAAGSIHGDGFEALEFRYPDWSDLSGSVTLLDVNGDTLSDIVLFLRGRTASGRRDSVRELVVFGQSALRDVGQLDVGHIGRGLRSEPVVTLDLRDAELLTDPAVRDLTGRRSRVWGRLALTVPPRPPASSVSAADSGMWSQVYPNPAVYTTTLEIAAVPSGDYTVSLVELGGKELTSRLVTVSEEFSLLSRLNLESVPAGYYLITVQRSGAQIGRWPILVVR